MAIKIEKKIVAYSIKKEEEEEEKPAKPVLPTRVLMHEDIERPDELKGYTYKIKNPPHRSRHVYHHQQYHVERR